MSIAEYAQNHGFPAQSSDYAKVLAALERERARSKRLEGDLESARQALDKAEQKSTALSENASSLKAAKASLELQMSSLRKDVEKSGEESARRRSTIDQLQSTVSDARTYNSGLEQANRQLRMTLETVAGDVQKELEDGWKTERTKLKEQNSALETENRAYRAELASLRAIVHAAQPAVSSTSGPAPIAVAPPQSLQEHIEPLRSQRCAWLNRFPRPYALPQFVNIEPIQELKTVTNILNKHAWRGLRNGRRYLNLVGRAVWTDPTQRVHLLCYSPTRYYHRDTNRWVEHAEIPSLLQQGEVDVFISCDTAVMYAGVFQAHSFRAGGPPSLERIPADVSKREMLHNMNGRNLPSETVPEDALLVECLGLQCVGFDEALYLRLRDEWLSSTGVLPPPPTSTSSSARTADPRVRPRSASGSGSRAYPSPPTPTYGIPTSLRESPRSIVGVKRKMSGATDGGDWDRADARTEDDVMGLCYD